MGSAVRSARSNAALAKRRRNLPRCIIRRFSRCASCGNIIRTGRFVRPPRHYVTPRVHRRRRRRERIMTPGFRTRGTSFVYAGPLRPANEEAIILLRYVMDGLGRTVTTRLSPGYWLAANNDPPSPSCLPSRSFPYFSRAIARYAKRTESPPPSAWGVRARAIY